MLRNCKINKGIKTKGILDKVQNLSLYDRGEIVYNHF